ncbi:hypothetical protein V1504DRAFT_430358 [Lipomyces starkeyi]
MKNKTLKSKLSRRTSMLVKKERDDNPESSNIQRSTLYRSESSSSTSGSTPSSSSVVPSGKRQKRHGPAVSSAWITQDPSGRGRPAAVAPQQQQEAEEAEFQLCRSLENKLVDSGVMRSQCHARDIAAQIVRGFRTDLHRTGVDEGAAFARVFGGVDGIDKIHFDIQFEDSGSTSAIADDDERDEDGTSADLAGSTTTTTTTTPYVVEWCIDLGGASAKFNRRVVVTNRGMSEDPNIEM